MTQNRFYSSNAVSTTLTGGVSSGATTLPVAATTGFPVSLPFTLILERDTANEEVVTVTGVSGLNLTVTRGVDGTAAVSHSVGATVQHGVSARDFSEPQAHMAASSGVHGLVGAVVGTSDAQTITNKTVTAQPASAATIPLTVKGAASQSANLQEWQDSTGAVKASVAAAGYAMFPSGVFGGSGAVNTGPRNMFAVNGPSEVALGVRGAASQTGDLQQWQNSGGTALAKVDASGNALFASQCRVAFDVELNGTGVGGGVPSVYIASQTGDATTINTGGQFYVKNGALMYRGPGGTITTVAPS